MTEKASRKAKNIFRSLARSLFGHFKVLILKFSNSLARSKNSISDYEELQIKLVWPKGTDKPPSQGYCLLLYVSYLAIYCTIETDMRKKDESEVTLGHFPPTKDLIFVRRYLFLMLPYGRITLFFNVSYKFGTILLCASFTYQRPNYISLYPLNCSLFSI